MLKSYYEILNVKRTAKKAEIKAQFRKLVRLYHPDINTSFEAETIFKEINKAAEVLLDDEKRKKYDEMTLVSSTPPFEKNKQQTKKETETKIKKDGDDITLSVTIDFKEALLGTKRVVNIAHSTVCPKCGGRKFANNLKCPYCNGVGEITDTRKITVKIPSGIKNKAKLRLIGEGHAGLNGGKPGNLYIIVNVKEKENFEIKNKTVYSVVKITPQMAVLGGNLTVATLWGTTTIKIPPLTKTNQSFKLIDVGLLNEKNNKKGEQIVKVIVDIPSDLSDEEIELYEKLNEIGLKKNKNANFR